MGAAVPGQVESASAFPDEPEAVACEGGSPDVARPAEPTGGSAPRAARVRRSVDRLCLLACAGLTGADDPAELGRNELDSGREGNGARARAPSSLPRSALVTGDPQSLHELEPAGSEAERDPRRREVRVVAVLKPPPAPSAVQRAQRGQALEIDDCVTIAEGLQPGDLPARPEHDAEVVSTVGGQPDGRTSRIKTSTEIPERNRRRVPRGRSRVYEH